MKQILRLMGTLCPKRKPKILTSKNLMPYVFYLATIKILFCVCLAHARQQGLGTPVATGVAFQNSYAVTGKILSATTNEPLDGATISIQGKRTKVLANADGAFRILASDSSGVLLISFVGYQSTEINFNRREAGPFTILLENNGTQLEEVEVSTGYQTLPKERATGSFVQVDNELLNRRVSTNILDRLDGVTSGLQFRSSSSIESYNPSLIQIRGRSTLSGNHQALIVVDNFVYDGDISSINPNDIADITVLKDAAAASAWGARSGNGVIVITTKRGKLNGGNQVNFSTNLSVGAKPDLYSAGTPQLSSAEYIAVEQFLFERGAYDNRIKNGYQGLSPAVEVFLKARNGLISNEESSQLIDEMKQRDSRKDLLRHYHQNTVNQQYNLNISGGGVNSKYYISGGYDRNRDNVVNSNAERFTLNVNDAYYLLQQKLEITSNLVFSSSYSGSGAMISNLYPYDRLMGDQGEALPLTNANGLRLNYTDTAGNGKLLDWAYRPLDELNRGTFNKSNLTSYRLNLAANYKLTPDLRVSLRYGLEKGHSINNNFNDLNSFYTRNLINTYSSIDYGNGGVSYGIPIGGILNNTTASLNSNNGRAQLDYNKSWGKHAVSALAGFEIKDNRSERNGIIYYGYDEQTKTNQNAAIDFTTNYAYYYGGTTGRVNTGITQSLTVDRFLSYYTNASYTYNSRYIASVSARRDESNLFGVKTNQKGVPLWSAGFAWVGSKEEFLQFEWLSQFKLRTTFGYTGNVDKGTSAYLTANSASYLINIYNALYADIVNPPNPSLRWEKVKNINVGLGVGLLKDRLNLNIDYWRKTGEDLIGPGPIAPQSGITTFTGNTANTRSRGWDIQVNTINLNGRFKWHTTLLFNQSSDRQVLKNRYRTGKAPAIAELAEEGEALDLVLRERRKELVWRCLRWNDLKRLNRDGYDITLRRTLGEGQYILNPNDPRYVFPIPQDEIDYSGIQQNER